MQLPKLLTEKVFGWRAASYPHDDFPAIAEILEWLGGEGHGQPRFLRTPQVRAIETYWYMRLVERTPGIFDLYRDLIPKKWSSARRSA